jgi:hypothetical protein
MLKDQTRLLVSAGSIAGLRLHSRKAFLTVRYLSLDTWGVTDSSFAGPRQVGVPRHIFTEYLGSVRLPLLAVPTPALIGQLAVVFVHLRMTMQTPSHLSLCSPGGGSSFRDTTPMFRESR